MSPPTISDYQRYYFRTVHFPREVGVPAGYVRVSPVDYCYWQLIREFVEVQKLLGWSLSRQFLADRTAIGELGVDNLEPRTWVTPTCKYILLSGLIAPRSY